MFYAGIVCQTSNSSSVPDQWMNLMSIYLFLAENQILPVNQNLCDACVYDCVKEENGRM